MMPHIDPHFKDSLDSEEVARFTKISSQWWDEEGPFKPLHQLNPTRIRYIRDQILNHFGAQENLSVDKCLKGRTIMDVGCGGGLVCEPLCRLGAMVSGIDASSETIEIAKSHAALQGLEIQYACRTVEDVAHSGQQVDVVLALEIVEHVADVAAFVKTCTMVLKPGGMLIMSTLNRTFKSYAMVILGAEYILRWVPVGTHQWSKFLTPAELAGHIRENDLSLSDVSGMTFNPLTHIWSLTKDVDVNYFLSARKEEAV